MAKIQINEFKGIMPKIANDKLPINMAQIASDLKTATGELIARRRATADLALPSDDYQSLFEYLEGGNSNWVYYNAIVHWVRSPVADDTFERMYTTGSHAQYKAFVNDIQGEDDFDFTTDFYYPGAPSAVANGLGYTDGGAKYRAYFYTYVSRYGEEGPPSALIETVDGNGTADWDGTSSCVLSGFTAPDADDDHLDTVIDGNAPAIRIYRTATDGAGAAEFLLVAEIAVDNTGPASTAWASYSYTDTDDWDQNGNLGEANTSGNYDRAPDNMSGLRGHPNGFYVAFKDNKLCFSEPFAPWAWPEDYQIPIDHTIVGLGITGSTVVVATDGYVYTFTGPHPTSLYKKKQSFQPCLSQRAIVESDDGVIFPSKEGFQLVGASSIQNVTRDLFRPEDWGEYELQTMHSAFYNKAYYGFYKSSDFEGYLVIDFLNSSITTGVDYHQATHITLADGIFKTIFNSDISSPETFFISSWDADPSEYKNFSYKSPRIILEKPHNFKVAQVILDVDFYNNLLEFLAESETLEDLNETAWALPLEGEINGAPLNCQDVNGDTLFSLRDLGVQNYVDFKLYVNSVLKFTKQVRTSDMFKLPRGFKHKKWEIVVEGMIPVKRITMATSTEEIV